MAPNPATHPILSRHYDRIGPPNERRRPCEGAASESLLAGEVSSVSYINPALTTTSQDNVASLDSRWFRGVCEAFPSVADKIFNRGPANEVVVSNAWGLGVNVDTWHVSLRWKEPGFIIDAAVSPIVRAIGVFTYILSFDSRSQAMRFGEELAKELGFELLDWTEDASVYGPDGGRSA
ncbi:hypothetical protein ACH0CP_12750 [Sphingomonas sp. 179-I 2A4 NHS]|uniref:hypothetical protein n=1 Tax=unclassified Sphingomonas TaxID=196159 RepID=UPI00387A0B78